MVTLRSLSRVLAICGAFSVLLLQGQVRGQAPPTKTLCAAPQLARCLQSSSFDENLTLVWSDEFDTSQGFGPRDGSWVAANVVPDAGSTTLEQFKATAVTVGSCDDGRQGVNCLRITLRKREGALAGDKHDEYAALGSSYKGDVQVSKGYDSGMVQTWNRRCFRAGYVEARVKLPGSPSRPGLIPGIHLVGNLARHGYQRSMAGVWPFSYNKCFQSATKQNYSANDPQLLTRCSPRQTKGRGAPEISLFELRHGVFDKAEFVPALLQGLKVAPLLPAGVSLSERRLTDLDDASVEDRMARYTSTQYGQAVQQEKLLQDKLSRRQQRYPLADGLAVLGEHSLTNPQRGPLSQGAAGRPGTANFDFFSVATTVDTDSYNNVFHTYGVYWEPNQVIRWYLDGTLVFELNNKALQEAASDTGEFVLERMIPVEPMYIGIFARIDGTLSDFQAWEDLDGQGTTMLVDYVRVYQRANASGGEYATCDPDNYPTRAWIACNKQLYSTKKRSADLGDTGTCPQDISQYAVLAAAGLLLLVSVALASYLCIATWLSNRAAEKSRGKVGAALRQETLNKQGSYGFS